MNPSATTPPRGRFAPSPSGRMHLGNLFTALISWLSVRSRGGEWILRIEDLDPQRSRPEYARMIEDDLLWLGLDWDEGGLDDRGPNGPYSQSRRGEIYSLMLRRIVRTGWTYRCRCTRAEILATQAPHQSDGRVIYGGRCRPAVIPQLPPPPDDAPGAVRLAIPEGTVRFDDRIFGPQKFDLATECGDFILRRADGAWAYQLAVVVDDALMGVTEVVRGCDLLLSAAQQIYLYRLLGFDPPEFVHLPLVCNSEGIRLSKRDSALSMAELRRRHTPESLLGLLASLAGLQPTAGPVSLADLLARFSLNPLRQKGTGTLRPGNYL
ncbi:MAG: tRNA glutamyl-Q(34) synthetase GluQRS [Clostridium sp.]|nr:tRNA glutamyl-Q(34) synthetase GluQRS [Clostridium sp.]